MTVAKGEAFLSKSRTGPCERKMSIVNFVTFVGETPNKSKAFGFVTRNRWLSSVMTTASTELASNFRNSCSLARAASGTLRGLSPTLRPMLMSMFCAWRRCTVTSLSARESCDPNLATSTGTSRRNAIRVIFISRDVKTVCCKISSCVGPPPVLFEECEGLEPGMPERVPVKSDRWDVNKGTLLLVASVCMKAAAFFCSEGGRDCAAFMLAWFPRSKQSTCRRRAAQGSWACSRHLSILTVARIPALPRTILGTFSTGLAMRGSSNGLRAGHRDQEIPT